MARNKMEKEFSEKLNQREIQPSTAAWDRLDAMLSAAEARPQVVKIKRSFKWLYVAAGFLGFLLVGTLFFRQGDTKAIDNGNRQVVETAKTPIQRPSQVEIEVQPEVQIAEASSEKVSETAKATTPSVRRKIEKLNSVQEQKTQLADNIINQNQSSNPIIDQKTDKLNQANSQIASSATADELLANAQAKREAQVNGVKVNAKSLLSQVDSQAEEKLSLRQKALRALNKNYQHVKVAVENRNLEENH